MTTKKSFRILCLAFIACATFAGQSSRAALLPLPIKVNSSGSVLAGLAQPNESGCARSGALTLISNAGAKGPLIGIYDRISQSEPEFAEPAAARMSSASFPESSSFAAMENVNSYRAESFMSNDLTPVPEIPTWFAALLAVIAVVLFHLTGLPQGRRH